MTKYLFKKSIGKVGINYVRNIVEANNCIFHEIHQENDVGIDAIIEFVRDENPLGKCIGVQIKSGQAYFDKRNNKCFIPIANHFDYWINYSLPVFGIVYIPKLRAAFWIDIKKYLGRWKRDLDLRKPRAIKFNISKLNKLTRKTFNSLFVPFVFGKIPELTFKESLGLFHSKNLDEVYVGLIVLFNRFADKSEVWGEFVRYFKNNRCEIMPPELIYMLSHIPWHSDLTKSITEEARQYARELISKFGKIEVIKLLEFIDEENFISRGSIGQCVEAIISSIPENDKYLQEIILNKKLRPNIREGAVAIYAYHKGRDSLKLLESMAPENNSWFIPQIIDFIKENNWFDPYA